MTRDQLVKRGIDSEYIHEITIGLDDLIESGFQDETEFFKDYCYFHDKLDYDYDIHRWITGIKQGCLLDILVWVERRD